jgi:GH24 family phage-related lysozyme (muramidase)
MADNIIKSYMVSLGFKVDEHQLKQFNDRVESFGKSLARVAEETTATLAVAAAAVTVLADKLNDLWVKSRLDDAPVGHLRAWQQAAQAAGLSIGQADSTLAGFAETMRSVAGRPLLQSLGIMPSGDNTKDLLDLVDRLKKMGKPGSAGYEMAKTYAAQFGISESSLHLLEESSPAVRQQYAASLAEQKKTGVDLDAEAKRAHDVTVRFELLKQRLEDLAFSIADKVFPVVEKMVPVFDRVFNFLDQFASKLNTTTAVIAGLVSVWLAKMGASAALRGAARMVGIGAPAEGAALGAEAVAGEEVAAGAAAVAPEAAAGAAAIAWPVLIAGAAAAAIAWITANPQKVGEAARAVVDWAKGAWQKMKEVAAPIIDKAKSATVKAVQAGEQGAKWTIQHPGEAINKLIDSTQDAYNKAIDSAKFWTANFAKGYSLQGLDDDILDRVAREEGHAKGGYSVYTDIAGNRTAGFGHKLEKGEDESAYKGMTEADSRQLLAYDLGKRFAEMRKYIMNKHLDSHQLTALLDLFYNIGAKNFASSTLLKDINAGDIEGAAREMLKWNKVQTSPGHYVINKGLEARRQREADELAGHHVEMNQQVTQNIYGGDSATVAQRVKDSQQGLSNDLLRNTVTALDNGRASQ